MDDQNPYSSPQLQNFGNTPQSQGGLRNLGQESRLKNLNSARWTLIIVGLITCGFNGYYLITLASNLPEWAILTLGLFAAGGAVLIILGGLIKRIPVIASVSGLVLYIVLNLGSLLLDPEMMLKGIIIKIFIIAGLVNAVKAAFAYENERKNEHFGN